MTPPEHPRRRRTDRSRAARAAHWIAWRFQAIVTTFMCLSAVAFGALGLAIYSQKSATDRAASELCDRAQRFGHLNLEEHRQIGVYKPEDLRDFERTIPQDCP
ncbi:hypothetical protein [Paraconexibacter algicola]|uniref:Uncharacterized protein n=1 Tax=Paraconexibacter algicola TaxID=2133960 RepID=A0A2T4UE24_9ACTN|nr:hypothetical protein [Paraconexibacter algicola]PTL55759.1 hypothetical protein C7Y72_19210 [Paraconexibacter algicola]